MNQVVVGEHRFEFMSLTASANKEPFIPGQIGKLKIFEEISVNTTSVELEQKEGRLSLVAPSPRGGIGEKVAHEKGMSRMLQVPHFQRDDHMRADEVQNVREFGSSNKSVSVMAKVHQKLSRHYRDMDATIEHQRMGALKGIVYDKNGNVMSNLYNEFGIPKPPVITIDLANKDTKPRQEFFPVVTRIEDALDSVTYSGLHALCGNDFWIKLIENPNIRETYLATEQAVKLRGETGGVQRFEYADIVFERYRVGKQAEKATKNTLADFIAKNECRVFPIGVPELYQTYFAPADYMETVNTMGLPRYVMPSPMKNNKGVEFEVQSNALNICTNPEVLQEIRLAS